MSWASALRCVIGEHAAEQSASTLRRNRRARLRCVTASAGAVRQGERDVASHRPCGALRLRPRRAAAASASIDPRLRRHFPP